MDHKSTINANPYRQQAWDRIILLNKKRQILNSTSQDMQEQARNGAINAVFRGKNISLTPLTTSDDCAMVVVDGKMPDGLCGEFDPVHNKIKINKQLLKDGKLSLETASHETTHKLQNGIATSREQYQCNSLEYEYATIAHMSASENELNAFGISSKGRLYMSGQKFPLRSVTAISKSLYALSAIERHACLTAMTISNQLPNADLFEARLDHLTYCETHLANALFNFKQSYFCQDMPIAQIYQAIDNAQTFIAFGYGITNDLEANIAYDMMAFIEYENSELTRQEALAVLYDRLNHDNKQLVLSQAGYSIIDQPYEFIGGKLIKNNLDISFLCEIEQLINMPQNMQTENPLMIANFAFEKEINVFHYLYCPEAFEEWLYSESSLRQLSRETQDGLGEILGDRYSLANRKLEIAKRLEQQSTQAINEDIGYVFEREDR